MNVFDFELGHDDLTAIAALDAGKSAFFVHRDPAIVKMVLSFKRNT